MKRFIAICLAAAALVGLGACTTAQQTNVQAAAKNAQLKVEQACTVVQPTLVDLSASMPNDVNLQLLVKDNAAFCAAVTNLDASTVSALVNTTVPSMITLVGLLPIDPATRTAIDLGLGAASVALSQFLMVYGQQPAPASGASAVSAP